MPQTQEHKKYDTWSLRRDEKQASCSHKWSHVLPHYCVKCDIKKIK